ncbi:MAG: hypothetical protein VKN33_02845 [Candidatus Sericytochromatia bacterium]|nr:hypothetical protein [Candidatus Sericytochromatia bacterium]
MFAAVGAFWTLSTLSASADVLLEEHLFAPQPTQGLEWSADPKGLGGGDELELLSMFYPHLTPTEAAQRGVKRPPPRVRNAHLKQFSHHWKRDITAIHESLQALSGQATLKVSTWYLDSQKSWVLHHSEGVAHLGLNARHLIPHPRAITRLKMAQIYFDAFTRQAPAEFAEPLTFARRLQLEGLRAVSTNRVAPRLPAYLLAGITIQEWSQCEKQTKQLAKSLLNAIAQPSNPNHRVDYFGPRSGGKGKYMAWLLAIQATKSQNPFLLARLPSSDYLYHIRPDLEWLAYER